MNARFLLCAGAAVALVSLASCAANAPAMSPRQAPVGPEPRSVEEAQADIDRWGAQLGIAPPPAPPASGAAGTASGPSTAPDRPAAAQPSAPPMTTQSSSESVSASGEERGASEPPSECVMPCRAIASMRRSVAALCRLSGEDDPRCVNARKTLEEGERRVARCGC
jgi:hypothetical protein